jgi:mono/diheme cytochrome c family protein
MTQKGKGVKTSAHVGIEKMNRCFPIVWQVGVTLLGSVLVFFAVAARAQNAASQADKGAASPAGNAEAGKKVFTKDGCYECHGREGQGAAQASGPRIGPSQRFVRPFITYVRQPTGQMPPYTTAVISDQELADIYAYLQSRPRAKPSKDIPLLNQ